ncbi:MAG: hypothetical protein ABSB15_00905 [Bryobacteraceae bacterium]|jgi:hypothetical protein
MNRKPALIGLGLACVLLGEREPQKKVQVTKTEKMDFPAGGTLRLEHSVGELTIEGWDQPGAEITTTKSTRAVYSQKEKEKETKDLDRIQISTELQGNELIVTTQYPSHVALPWFTTLDHVEKFDLDYHIEVPRNAKLVIKHDDGEVHIIDVAGNIDASARQGLIAVSLTGDAPRSIDAKSKIGSVNSDFPGNEKAHELFIGHTFVAGGATAAQSLKLRIAYGDLIIGKSFHSEPVPSSR